jgi:hypothetical protein
MSVSIGSPSEIYCNTVNNKGQGRLLPLSLFQTNVWDVALDLQQSAKALAAVGRYKC